MAQENQKLSDERVNRFNSPWIGVLLLLLSVVFTYFLIIVNGLIGFRLMLLWLSALFLICISATLLCLLLTRELMHNEIERFVKQALLEAEQNSIFKIGHNCIPGFFVDTEIAEMERTKCFSEIWLVSNDLKTEVNDGTYAGVVPYNLMRGFKYIYFVPQTDITSVRIQQLKRTAKFNENLKFYFLNDDFFFLAPNFDFSIYEPYNTPSEGRLAFMGLEIPGIEKRFEVKMCDDLVDSICSKLLSCMESSEPV